MTATELFASFEPGQSSNVLGWLMENDRSAYKACTGLLAGRRKLRAVFVERKPRDERNAWIAAALSKPANADVATEILQAWILGAHQAMVCGFLDELKVPHDGKGIIENLPPEPPADAIRTAVDNLFAKFPPEAVSAYLNLFVSMDIAEWPALRTLVESDPRLCPALTNT